MIVLDTHALLWWTQNSDKLSSDAREVVEEAKAQNCIYVSSMSVWEVSMLVKKERLSLKQTSQDWLTQVEGLSFITFVPVNNQIAQNSVHLDMHPDPADRIIAATTLYLGATLITKDEKLQKLKDLKTLW